MQTLIHKIWVRAGNEAFLASSLAVPLPLAHGLASTTSALGAWLDRMLLRSERNDETVFRTTSYNVIPSFFIRKKNEEPDSTVRCYSTRQP